MCSSLILKTIKGGKENILGGIDSFARILTTSEEKYSGLKNIHLLSRGRKHGTLNRHNTQLF